MDTSEATFQLRFGHVTAQEREGGGLRLVITMTSERYYREEATRCRERAAVSRDTISKRRWLEVAEECDQLRDAFTASSHRHVRPDFGFVSTGRALRPSQS